MKTFKFEKAEHPEYGGDGWRMVGTDMDPLGGMGVAHDILEHFGESSVTITSELQALGASFFTRRDYYSAMGKYDPMPGHHVAADIPEICRCILQGETLDKPKRTVQCAAEADIDDMFSKFMGEWVHEFDESDRHEIREQFPVIRAWLRTGYRKAVRRYKGRSSWGVTNLFMKIEKEADRLLKGAESFEVLVVQVNFRDLTVKVFTEYPEDDY